MLKIKDNIDLNLLLKLGFTYDRFEGEFSKRLDEDLVIIVKNRQIYLFVDGEIYNSCISSKSLDFLFDLIKAGFLERFVKE